MQFFAFLKHTFCQTFSSYHLTYKFDLLKGYKHILLHDFSPKIIITFLLFLQLSGQREKLRYDSSKIKNKKFNMAAGTTADKRQSCSPAEYSAKRDPVRDAMDCHRASRTESWKTWTASEPAEQSSRTHELPHSQQNRVPEHMNCLIAIRTEFQNTWTP